MESGSSFEAVDGIAYYDTSRTVKTTPRRGLITDFGKLPFPDFNLVRYAKLKMYPVNRSRGCNMNCEFCAVKDRTRCDSPEHMLEQIKQLVETRGARKFFEVSDHFASDREEAVRFCNLLAEYQKKIGRRLGLTIQTRITDARYPELLEAMKRAGIYNICIGYESPIDEELSAMRKGYLSKDMLEWTAAFHRFGFFIHGMFIFGYPRKKGEVVDPAVRRIGLDERVKRFRTFINKGRIDTAQVLLAVPLPGTELKARLEAEGRLYPLDQIGWEYYDGQFPLFEPDDGVSPSEVQTAMRKIMARFYSFSAVWRLAGNIVFGFPLVLFPALFTLVTLRVNYLTGAFFLWKKKFFRNNLLRFGGYIVIKNWVRQFSGSDFMERLGKAREKTLRRLSGQGKRGLSPKL